MWTAIIEDSVSSLPADVHCTLHDICQLSTDATALRWSLGIASDAPNTIQVTFVGLCASVGGRSAISCFSSVSIT